MAVQKVGIRGSVDETVKEGKEIKDTASHSCNNNNTTDNSVRAFTERTSLHGCSYITQPEYPVIRRATWSVLLLASTAVFLSSFINGIVRYRSYPSSVSVTVKPNRRLSLPDVTVCNNNLIRRSVIESREDIIAALFQPTNLSQTAIESLNATNAERFFLSGLDPLEEFITDCAHNQVPFECHEYAKIYIGISGGCYTISPANFSVGRTRPVDGLRFQISLNESEYFMPKSQMDGVGVKLMFHDPGQMVDGENGIRVGPETDVYVAVRKSQNIRLGLPYSEEDCRAEADPVNYTLATSYTRQGCEVECVMTYFRDVVGCSYSGNMDGVQRECSLLEMALYTEAAMEYSESDACVCLRPCTETIYATDVTSLAHRDTLSTHNNLQAPLWSSSPSPSPASPSSAPHNRLKRISVNVYYPSLDLTVTSQTPAYDIDSLIADSGGQMGLFLGASILTLTEFLEYILIRIIQLFK